MNSRVAAGTFIEVGHYQLNKAGQGAAGDTFISRKNETDGRVITVLSDGLGSGIKAGVLSTLTATMALKFVASDIPPRRAASIIMNTLPVCRERGISYATFTLIDIEPNATTNIIEYDNPGYILMRQNQVIGPAKTSLNVERNAKSRIPGGHTQLNYSSFTAQADDRLVFFSDGVTQSGMGTKAFPLGWGESSVQDFVEKTVSEQPLISARDLARSIVLRAHQHDVYQAKDDITCGVIYFRRPRNLLIVTGPPINPEHDTELAHSFSSFTGSRIVCGGTTANILSRLLHTPYKIMLKDIDPSVPPMSEMEGANLVTEGIITLARVAELLEKGSRFGNYNILEGERDNAATRIVEMLLDNDRILFIVGTRINEAHQDPNMPVELEIRRNVVKKIRDLLTTHYLKDVSIRYI